MSFLLTATLFSITFGSYVLWKHVTTRMFKASPNKNRKETCLFTGASKGIGKEIARLFVRDGFNLIMVARGEEDLQKTKQEFEALNSGVRIFIIRKDLGTNDNAPQEIFDEIMAGKEYQDLQINYLVNDAGLCLRGEFLEIPLDRQLAMANVLATSYLKMCYLWGNYWKKNKTSKQRRILNVSSVGGVMKFPLLATYCAAKHFTHALSICLWDEFSKYNISVTSLLPGHTWTPAIPKAGLENTLIFRLNMHDSAERVAVKAYHAMMHGQNYIVIGWMNHMMYWLSEAILPYGLFQKFIKGVGIADAEELLHPGEVLKQGLQVKSGNDNERIKPSEQ